MSEATRSVVLVAGGTGGLGGAVAEAFVEAGAEVVVASRGGGASGGATGVAVDLTDERSVERAIGALVERRGRLDVLVNVVGGFAMGEPIATLATETWESMLRINLHAPFYLCRAALRPMLAQRAGRIVNVGSRAAVEPQPRAAAYAVSKSALVALTRNLAEELRGTGVTANVVLPGTIDTPANRAAMPDADRAGWVAPEEIARAVAFLAGPGGAAINGAVVPVFGGG